MLKRTLSDLEDGTNDENRNLNRRMSLPVTGKSIDLQDASEGTESTFLPLSNRRHTLMPLRSILKSSGNDPTITMNRRVSFAGQVSVHKFQVSSASRKKPKSSAPLVPSKLSIHDYMKRRGDVNFNVQDSINEMNDRSHDEDMEKQERINKEIADLHAMKYQNNNEIHEDNSTQTMEMSVELTNQIKEQQKAVLEQSEEDLDDLDDNNEETDSFRELFEDLDDDLDDDGQNSQGDGMELTQPIQPIPILESPEIERAMLELEETATMELTQPVKLAINTETDDMSENTGIIDMEMTQPINKGSEIEIDDQTETMEIDSKMVIPPGPEIEVDEQTQTMNLTQIVQLLPRQESSESPIAQMDESTMEFTAHIQNIPQEAEHIPSPSEDTEITFNPVPLSTVAEISEPASLESSSTNDVTVDQQPIVSTPPRIAQPSNTHENANSSVGEISFVTEMIPLADVSDTSLIQSDNFESADILEDDDNYVNVTLGTFLRDINVQFYELIGPSDREIQETLNIIRSDSNIPTDSPSTSSNLSTSSTPLKSQSVATEERRQTLLDYIDAANNILYYHYLNHIINQYMASIGTISNMVDKFSTDVKESNLLTMREYYNQSIEFKSDLRTNYQAIASFTRKQSQNENMQFISGLLEQLISSYDKAKGDLTIELEKAIDWRKDVLIERQQMIEKKMDLSKVVERLLKVKNQWAMMDIPKWKETTEKIKVVSSENKLLENDIQSLTNIKDQEQIKLQGLKDVKIQLVKEVTGLTDQLESMKMPMDIELNQLTNQLKDLEIKSGIRLISESPLGFIVNDDLKVIFSESTLDVNLQILRLRHFEPYEQLVELFISKFIEGNAKTEPFLFIKNLKLEWHKFKQLWKDLATLYYIYPTVVNHDGLTVDFQFGKLKFNCSFDDLLDESKQIKVEILNNGNDDELRKKLENGSWSEEFQLFKRLEYL